MRLRPGVGSLRAGRVHGALRAALGAAQRADFRVVHYSAQADHLHLLVEAHDRDALSAGVRGLTIRLARAVNRALGRRGPVWDGRYHRRDLTSPREVHAALRYVLCNFRKHDAGVPRFDPCSSAAWFDGWRGKRAGAVAAGGAGAVAAGGAGAVAAGDDARGGSPPVREARTWLLARGWRRHGLLDPAETPGERESWRAVAAARGWEWRRAGA